jgi:tRNA (guanine37-N1)-methyltransferase
MNFNVITIFPEMFAAMQYGIVGRALDSGLIKLSCLNPRDFTDDKTGRIDDRPYGGGPGMVMEVLPLQKAISAFKKQDDFANFAASEKATIYLSPQGKMLDQEVVKDLAAYKGLILIAGRYEGVDERLIETEIDFELSVGDYVLSGGELAAMILIDTITRTLPGALGDENSANQDSFSEGLLDYPHYTRPETVVQKAVPQVLLSGNHEAIARWRLKQALGRTWLRRPDLLKKRQLTKEEMALLNEFIEDMSKK